MSVADDLDHLVLPDPWTAFCLGDAVRDGHDQLLGHIDRAVVTPDLRRLTHVGVQPVQHWKWPRLVPLDELRRTSLGARTHVLVDADGWPGDHPTADVLPGCTEEELPDHPPVPTSGVQRFLLAMTTSGPDSPLSIASTLKPRMPAGEATLRPGCHLVEQDERSVSSVGEVVGLVIDRATDAVAEVLVVHRHGWRHRTARLPVHLVREAGIGQVTTRAGRSDLDRYDIRDAG
jgi:membrane-associated protease RseP (regulator of RpoE activity)